jgi:histidinol-phosphate phosphatase family protein
VSFDVLIPTVGRASLATLLEAIERSRGPLPDRVVIADDRSSPDVPLPVPLLDRIGERIEVVRTGGGGPAAARNAGMERCRSEWVALLDDDVIPEGDWLELLERDLREAPPGAAAVQGVLRVPLPAGRRATDWERNVGALEEARWATADIAYRRGDLIAAGGFDERFRRAYREDAELALRVREAGGSLVKGRRSVLHPVGPAGFWKSVRLQRQNADDALMLALHGRRWRERADAPAGRRPRHLVITAAGLIAVAAAGRGRRLLAATAAASWLAGTAELAAARIAPGPRDRDEVVKMAVTSVVLPAAATLHWLAGLARWLPAGPRPVQPRPEAVLLDRDGTLVVDVPFNGDPRRVVPMPGAREAVARLRKAGVPVAVVSNQSGIARGLISHDQVQAVHRRIEELLGPLGPWTVCPHGPDDDCACRKPRPGLVEEAAQALGVDPSRCAVVGDIGSDIEAAAAAGARPVLVPTPNTLPSEIRAAPEVAPDLPSAVELLIGRHS